MPEIAGAGRMGVSWCGSGGESSALLSENHLAADGIENVINVLENLEDEKLGELDFIELNACAAGCVGGVLTVENPYIAVARIKKLRRFMPVSLNHYSPAEKSRIEWDTPVKAAHIMKLSDDYSEAIEKMNQMARITDDLPGLDCGSCGAPTCEALAEDVVRGVANVNDCIFKLRDHVQDLISEMVKLEGYIPPPFRMPKTADGRPVGAGAGVIQAGGYGAQASANVGRVGANSGQAGAYSRQEGANSGQVGANAAQVDGYGAQAGETTKEEVR